MNPLSWRFCFCFHCILVALGMCLPKQNVSTAHVLISSNTLGSYSLFGTVSPVHGRHSLMVLIAWGSSCALLFKGDAKPTSYSSSEKSFLLLNSKIVLLVIEYKFDLWVTCWSLFSNTAKETPHSKTDSDKLHRGEIYTSLEMFSDNVFYYYKIKEFKDDD